MGDIITYLIGAIILFVAGLGIWRSVRLSSKGKCSGCNGSCKSCTMGMGKNKV